MLAGCGGAGEGGEAVGASARERATTAIRECRVRSVVSLHSGALVVELEGGGHLELSNADNRAIQAAIERARPRCGDVVVATE